MNISYDKIPEKIKPELRTAIECLQVARRVLEPGAKHTCDHCGLTKTENPTEAVIADSLDAMIEKLIRWAK